VRPVFNSAATIVTLAGNNLVEYFNINPTGGAAIASNNVTTGATVHDITVTGTGTGGGVAITGTSTGSTFAFSNLVIGTQAGVAFSAAGPGPAATTGGTVVVTTGATPNTLTTTTGTALNVVNTTIGASNLNFRSIAAGTGASGPANGILLNNTGLTGGLIVTGDGGGANNGSGGTIQTTTGDGILLTNVANISLGYMNVTNPGLTGIKVIPAGWTFSPANSSTSNGVTNFTLNRCNLSDNAGAVASDDGLTLSNASGAISLTNNVINLARHQGVTVDNFSVNMASFTMTGNTVSNTPGGDGMLMQMRGTSVLTSGTIGAPGVGNGFTSNSATGLQVNNSDTGNIQSLTVQNNTVSGNNAGMDFDLGQSSSMTVVVLNNTYNTQHTTALNLVQSTSSTAGSLTATLRGNQIGTQGVLDSGSAIGSGIRIANGGVNLSFTIDNNTIREVPNGRGIDLEPQAYTVIANVKAQIINNTIVRPTGTNQNIGCGANTPCPLASIFALSDSNGLGGFDHVCTKISGNSAYDPTSWPVGGEAAFYFARRTSASNTLNLEGTQANVTAQITATNTITNNSGNAVVDENTSGPVTIVAAGTCGAFPP